MIHSSITMTPYKATKPSNAIDVKHIIKLQSSFTIKFPELEIGSNVKLYEKKTLGQKERICRFSPAIFTIDNITEQHGQKYYNVEGNYRLYLRVELRFEIRQGALVYPSKVGLESQQVGI